VEIILFRLTGRLLEGNLANALERDNGTSITDKALIAGRVARRLRPSMSGM